MVTRNLTEVFMLMRNNAMRNRHIYAEDVSENMALVELYDVEQEAAENNRMPPAWIDQLEEAQFTLTKLKTKISELNMLHSQHLHKPTFDENSDEELLIEGCTSEITSMFNNIHRIVQFIKSHVYEGTPKERLLTANVLRSLANALQDLSINFRASQNAYIKQLKSREERSKMYFENSTFENDFDIFTNQSENIDDFFVNSSKHMTQQQLLYLEEENMQMAQQREHEVNVVVKSIVELNEIFKDLSQMVSDQGSVLDRIDYNIEQTHTQVYEGFKQLQKADSYQRKNRKMWAIIILAATTILLVFILIVVKS
ncbi:hypothetical protein RI129_003131 [Pyrocoelia pectoralis]|uniref:t-SNARE coiled-coil homology domain-containing protein n=1 Tax=Pyrocoelia pectoralis TaxID=417401 RepID=A0AAN7VQG1_9COLE